ncbi:MAG TPA: rhomboid family intramembrane serine protease [Candidatus Onthomonas avicola]|nr:rhomboid family intramembrane serine protease [Candidatus Onthomonas avicola]
MKLLHKIQYNSPVILTFALLSLGVLFLGIWTGGQSTALCFSVYRAPLTDPLTYLRFFTHVLGHSGYSHYIGNMTLLLVIGPPMEERYGSRTLLELMVATAFLSGLVQFLCFPGTALLGASGIVFMLIILSSLAGAEKGRIPLTLILVYVIYIGGEIADGVLQADNVSQLTHIIGGTCGAVFGLSLRRGKR